MPHGRGLLVGRVVDGVSGEAVDGARVMLQGTSDWVLSDAEGRFVYFDVPPGRHRLAAAKAGYTYSEFGQRWAHASQPVVLPGEVDPRGQFIELADGERRGNLVIRLWRLGAITGRILDEAGQPAVGSPVQAWARVHAAGRPWLRSSLPLTGRSDDRGVYRIPEVPAGEYVVVVPALSLSAPADWTPPAEWFAPEWLRAARAFTPRAPLAAALPSAGNALTSGAWRVGLAGRRVAPRPGEGPVWVYPTVFYPGVLAAEAANPVPVRAGGETSGIDIRLTAVEGRVVAGRVDSPDRSTAHVTVALRAGSSEIDPIDVALAVTDASGEFAFVGVPPGVYEAEVFERALAGRPSWFAPRDTPDTAGLAIVRLAPDGERPARRASTPVVVGDTDLRDLRLSLGPPARIHGRVVFAGRSSPSAGRALAQVALDLDPAHGRLPAALVTGELLVAEDGTFTSAGVPPGRYYLRAPRPPSGWVLDSARYQGRDVSLETLDVAAEAITGIVVTFTDSPASLAGVVRTRAGAPDADAAVAVLPVDRSAWADYGRFPRRLGWVRVDPYGRFSFAGLPAGEYWVVAIDSAELTGWHTPAFFEALSRVADRVVVGDRDLRTVDLVSRAIR